MLRLRLVGALLVSIGLVMALGGAGASDMEMARAAVFSQAQVHPFTGVPIAIIGVGIILLGLLFIQADPKRE